MCMLRARKQHLTTLNHTHLHNSHLPFTQMYIMVLSNVQLSYIRYMSHTFVLVSYFSLLPVFQKCGLLKIIKVCIFYVVMSLMFMAENAINSND